MFFYHFDMLDSFIKNNLMINLKIEKENIMQIITLYNNKKNNLLDITTNMIEIADVINQKNLDYFYNTISSLKNSFENVNNIQILACKLNENLTEIISLYDKGSENNHEEIKANLIEYNKQLEDLFNKIIEFENINTSVLSTAIELSLKFSLKKSKKLNTLPNNFTDKVKKIFDIELESSDNNFLIVSEKEQKAYLPFFYSDVKNIYQNSENHYKTLQDVVNDLYVLPLSRFKNSAIARFRESFNLIRNKEKGSITKALDLGLELMFKYELSPIIISACRNLDELDIYLDCLEENELYNFTCFEIKFEIMPQTKSK